MASELLQLSTIISSSVEELLTLSTENAWSLPVLSEPFDPAKNLFRQNANASHAATKIIAAAMQLATTLMTPAQAIQSCAGGPTKAAAMRVCLGLSVPEILRDAGPEGLHVVDIVQKSGSGVDSDKLARIMRYLANSHFYREVKSDVFAHTMTSSILDTGKSIQEILADPAAKHSDGTRGLVALCEYRLDEGAKASTMLLENMTDPKTAFSDDPTHSPSQRVFKHNLPIFDWYELPENTYRRRRFGIGMIGVAALLGESILEEFDWSTVPEGSVVVDVGGGFGASAKFIISHAPQVRVVVQDKPEVVAAGRQAWESHSPDLLDSKRVVFQSHDIFTPQPDNHATVFVLKNIIHNWGDSYSLKMLSHLRAAASPDTKLLVIGSILQHLCPSAHNSDSAPLLPSYGVVGDNQYFLDMVMLNAFNAREHTAESLDALLRKSGWKSDTIYGTENIGDGQQLTVASPI
ncbi:O-methyltransferase-domain-containing protein [Mycena vulgaris]|nr:O-methyltransferase-domain-containing protein [Mycena vulgaris]